MGYANISSGRTSGASSLAETMTTLKTDNISNIANGMMQV
jgi:hypothetical protein